MPNYTRAYQKAGDFTALEISQKEHNDQAAAYYKQQLLLIADQKEYASTIKRATNITARATVVIALAMIVQCIVILAR